MLHDRLTHCTYGTETINIKLGDKKQIIYITSYQTGSSMQSYIAFCCPTLHMHNSLC